eukprot:6202121-Pleurochrysis_carterae.AAC.1
MAEQAGEHAGAMFSSPTIPLSARRGPERDEAEPEAAGGRTGGGGKTPRAGAGRGVASGPPSRPPLRLGEVGALGFAESSHHREPKGAEMGQAPMALQPQSPARSHREGRLVSQYTGDRLAGGENLISRPAASLLALVILPVDTGRGGPTPLPDREVVRATRYPLMD